VKKILFILVLICGISYGQDYTRGKQLFNTHCAACHKMDKKLVGPALNTIVDRQGKEWTKEWIYNNNALRESGDEYAIQIWEEYNKAAMPGYQFLKDEELDDIVDITSKTQTTNLYLMKKLHMDQDRVDGEIDNIIKKEVSKKINKKVKILKKEINDKLKDFN
jgi:cytochrome c2